MIKTVDNLTKEEAQNVYQPRGASLEVFYCQDEEVVISGSAGTGKTRGVLEKINLVAQKYAGCRILLTRKTRESMTESVLKTFEADVLPKDSPLTKGAERANRSRYLYGNGSEIVVAGMTQGRRDNKAKVMSTEYDLIFVAEATELTETDWENLTTRLRNGVMPYQQIIGDCNPDAPTHWLKRRCDEGTATLFYSRHEDNDRMYNVEIGDWTAYGKAYMARLDNLTGIRRLRLRDGLWVQAEGAVFSYNEADHLIDRIPIPRDWSRYWVVDFGFNNPFVWQEWAEDHDGRLYRVNEIYRTRSLVEDLAKEIRAVTKASPAPRAVICDHDAEDRATLERHLRISTQPAYKDITSGIDAVNSRLKVQRDGKPRMYFLRNSLVSRDARLVEDRLPTCTEEEIGAYVWDERKERPVKENDHGCDCVRYMSAFKDIRKRSGIAVRSFAR